MWPLKNPVPCTSQVTGKSSPTFLDKVSWVRDRSCAWRKWPVLFPSFEGICLIRPISGFHFYYFYVCTYIWFRAFSFDYLKIDPVDVKLATFVFKTWLTRLPEELKFFSYGNKHTCRFWHNRLRTLWSFSACLLGVKCLLFVCLRPGVLLLLRWSCLYTQELQLPPHISVSGVWSACFLPKILICFLFMSLSVWIGGHFVYLVPVEDRQGCWSHWNWNDKWFWLASYGSPLRKQLVLLPLSHRSSPGVT